LNAGRNEAGSAVIDGKLYVVGGHNYLSAVLPVEEYDPATDTWTARAMFKQGEKMGVAALQGRLYVVGADWGEVEVTPWLQSYDPVTDEWTPRAAPTTARMQLEAVSINGLLYAFGGMSLRNGYVDVLEVYDPVTDSWRTKAPMPQGRRYPAVAVLNGFLYVIGGEADGPGIEATEILSSVVVYNPETDSWSTKASLPVRVSSATAAVVNGKIYVAGGGTLSTTATPYVYAYDPLRDTWSIQPVMHTSRWGATAAVVEGMIYVIGGIGRGAVLHDVEGLSP
jgi:N-acetylneuraminic acid mutarotase